MKVGRTLRITFSGLFPKDSCSLAPNTNP